MTILKARKKTALTGGTETALDGIDGDLLNDGDFAFVMLSGIVYVYELDADSGAAESSPGVIAPDTNAGNKRWTLQQSYAAAATTSSSGIVELATDAETLTGSATDRATTPSNLTGMGLLPLGTAGQVLRVNSGASALEYGTVSSTVPIGHLSGLTVSRKDNDEIYVSGGSIEIDEVLYNSDEQLAVAPGGEPTGYGSDLFAWTSKYATASSYVMGNEPYQALDDTVSSGWSPNVSTGIRWWQYQFSEAKRLEKVTIQANNVYKNAPTDWTLQASNTGAFEGEQVTLLTVADDDTWATSQKKEWTFTNATAYTYYRFNITEWLHGGAGGDGMIVAEFEGMEAVYTLAASTPYYVYVDPPASGTELAAENLIISATAPSFDSAKGGYYHPTNTDQRAIAHFTTDASGYVPTSGFIPYAPVTGPLGDAFPIVRSTIKEVVKSATGSLLAAECMGTIINNYGQTDDATLTLPAAASGLSFMVVCGTTVAKYLRLDPQAGDQIFLDGTGAGDGKYVGIASAAAGAAISFVAIQTGESAYDWVATTISGTWAAE